MIGGQKDETVLTETRITTQALHDRLQCFEVLFGHLEKLGVVEKGELKRVAEGKLGFQRK